MFTHFLTVAAIALLGQVTPADTSAGRKLVRLINAESAQLIEREGINYRKVTGPAHFLHNDTYIICDSAIWNVEKNVVDAMGNVQVIQNETLLYSDKIHYVADSSLAKVRGNLVQLVDKESNTLRTHFLDFHTRDSVARFFRGGSMRNKDGAIIESSNGIYESKIKRFKFLNNVEMESDSTLIKADSLEYHTEISKAFFLGQTHVWQDTVYLRANSGWYEKDTERYLFSNNAYILTKEQEVWADTIYYDKRVEIADLSNNIQVVDTIQKVMFFADKGKYTKDPLNVVLYQNPSMAYYSISENVSDTLFLSADTLKYYTRPIGELDSAFVATSKNRYIESKKDPLETLIENVKKERKAQQLQNSLPEKEVKPAKQPSDSLENKIIKEEITPEIESPDSDTTTIRFALAYHNVKVFRGDMQARSDSLTFNSIDSIARMFVNPIMWNEGSQFTADSIQFVLSGKKLSKSELMSNAYYISKEDSLYFNQIKSTDMIGFFNENKLSRFDALGGATLLFFLAEDSVITMMNEKECKFLSAAIDSGKLSRVKYFDGIKSDLFPLVSIEKGKDKLKGFIWRENERPVTRFDVCDRLVRPTENEKTIRIEKPLFPNTRRFFPITEQAGLSSDLPNNQSSFEKSSLPYIQR
ncbi:MAG: OstA-like protein [Bacteroidales bacterium]|nr:OstA-like protein [Bacteroidales bacterium]MDD4058562.1 OstA-like protein [Bacteroidales bacterium]